MGGRVVGVLALSSLRYAWSYVGPFDRGEIDALSKDAGKPSLHYISPVQESMLCTAHTTVNRVDFAKSISDLSSIFSPETPLHPPKAPRNKLASHFSMQ